MSLFPSTYDDYEHAAQVSRLFISGVMLLHGMLTENDPTTFKVWASRLREDKSFENGLLTDDRLMWLWDMLRSEPELEHKFGSLPPAAAPWAGTKRLIKVFEPGEWFAIGLKRDTVTALLKRPHKNATEETVSVKTLQPLSMKSGKGGRLECCDCEAMVTIRVAEIHPPAREADIMEVDVGRITLGDGVVIVQVDSLNQAYTVSSRRLEPGRRSHGGRTYDHLVHVGKEKRTPLEAIRRQVENGDWITPESVQTSTAGTQASH
jgi:hypothetical protein